MSNEAEVRTGASHTSPADPASITITHRRAGIAEIRLGQFSGSGLLDLALAGCVFNNVVRAAAEKGIRIEQARVSVAGDFNDEGSSAGVECRVEVSGDATPDQLHELARGAFDESTVAAVLRRAGKIDFYGP